MAERKHELTAARNSKALPRDLVISWVKKASDSVTRNIIVRQFEACDITTTEMNKIHYTYAQNDHTGAREAILQWQQESHDVSSQSNDEQGSARETVQIWKTNMIMVLTKWLMLFSV